MKTPLQWWRWAGHYAPFATLLRQRLVIAILFSFVTIYLFFTLCEISLWRCPWRELTGWRCPGCGLTTGCKALLQGELGAGVRAHWLSPFVILALLLLPVILALPSAVRSKVLTRFEKFERRTRLFFLLLVFFLIQAGIRLLGWA